MQQEPVPGAGHHYIGMGAETVNPADGSISFNLPIQTPAGRQLSFPFSISFNSSEPFYITNNGTGSSGSTSFGWVTPTYNNASSAPPFTLNGWGYGLPHYSASAFIAYSQNGQSSGCGNPYSGSACMDYCWETQGYNFTGLDNSSHVLYLANTWLDPSSADLIAQPTLCGQPEQSNGGAVGLQTSFGPPTAGTNTNTQPALSVIDTAGTVYSFPQDSVFTGSPSGGSTSFGALAQTITDRNGNQIVLNGTSAVGGGSSLPAGSYVDTAGRDVLAWTGIGNSNGDRITVSGLSSNIVVKWKATTATLPTNSSFVAGNPSSVSSCGFGGRGSIPMKVVSEIDLPNGQTYSFQYGGAYGLLNRITFPDGGYVRYTWGPNSSSKATYQAWIVAAVSGSADGSTGATNSQQSCWAIVDAPAITDRYVSYDGSSEVLHQHFSYGTTWVKTDPNQVYWTAKTTNVTSTDYISNQTFATTYTYSPSAAYLGPNDGPQALKANPVGSGVVSYMNWQSPQIPVETQVLYQDGGNKTYKTINKTWYDQYTMVEDQTVLDNGQGMTTLQCPDSYDRVVASYEFNFQTAGSSPSSYPLCSAVTLNRNANTAAIGPLMRQTMTAYHSFPGTNILNEPDSVTVSTPGGGKVSYTVYAYDQTAVVSSGTSVKAGLVAPPGARGNATSVSRWLNTSSTPLTTTYTYFDTGQVQSMTDPCGSVGCSDIPSANHTTSYSYADHFAPGTGSSSVQTNSYLTHVTYPDTGVSHTEAYTWGFTDGLLRSHVDQNNQATTYQYNDPLLRLKMVQGPVDANNDNQSPTTSYTYNDYTPSNPTSSSVNKSVLQNSSGTMVTSQTILDGMGHAVHNLMTSDPSGTVTVDTVYSGLGTVFSVSNPYRSTSETTYGVTTYTYDPLGRKTLQLDSDGVSSQSWIYSGPTTIYVDENKHQWQRTADALGRLQTVKEPNGQSLTATMETDYGYDLLNNLVSVNQCGGSCPGSTPVSRSFSYDSVSRLIQAYNPEAGWTCYGTTGGSAANGSNCTSGYDANGNLAWKTDARGIATHYSFDSLNRVLSKTYTNDPSRTPSSCFQYDSSSTPFSIGRLTSDWTQSSSAGQCGAAPPGTGLLSKRSILAYDSMGRITSDSQCTPATCNGTAYSPTYSFDLAGNTTSGTNGITSTPTVNTLTFTSGFDAVNRLLTVSSNWSDATHPSAMFSAQNATNLPCMNALSAPYSPSGSLANASLGNSINLNRSYDNRLRITCENDTGIAPGTSTNASATLTITGAEQSK